MKTDIQVKIITDIDKFQDRVDELGSDVSYDRVKNVVSRLKRALYNNSDVAGLCAPQIGENLRLFVVRTAKEESNRFHVFLNPMVISSSKDIHLSRENSPSIPNKEFIIPRKNKIAVAYQKENGEVDSQAYVGAYGEIVQQMIEMLDGITLLDYGFDLDDVGGPRVFDKATKKAKAEVMTMYLDTLKKESSKLTEEIETTPNLKSMNDSIKFMTEVLEGNITGVPEGEDPQKVMDALIEKQEEEAKKIKKDIKSKKE